MAKTSRCDTKTRILAIAKMLCERRRITSTEILRRLDLHYDIQVDRKTIKEDIYAIDRFFPIEIVSGRNGGYKKHNVLEEADG